MKIERKGILTGVLVITTVGAFVALLIYLCSPGVFVKQKKFRVYFDNAGGLKPGAEVLLAGRKIGRVHQLYSPVPESERPNPKLEAMVEVQVDATSSVYQQVKVTLGQAAVLGSQSIDFTTGQESSGLAPENYAFIGERPGGVADIVPTVLEKLDPALKKLTDTLESLKKTADNFATITAEESDLPKALAQFRQFGANLNKLSGVEGPLHRTLSNFERLTGSGGKLREVLDGLERLTGPESRIASAMTNLDQITSKIAKDEDIEVTLRNFRQTSERLSSTMKQLGPHLTAIAENLEQASATLKQQPWRLVWPSTKKYPGETPTATPPKQSKPSLMPSTKR